MGYVTSESTYWTYQRLSRATEGVAAEAWGELPFVYGHELEFWTKCAMLITFFLADLVFTRRLNSDAPPCKNISMTAGST